MATSEQHNVERLIEDYLQGNNNIQLNRVSKPQVDAPHFQIQPALIMLVRANQYNGSPMHDAVDHITTFLDLCETIKLNGVHEDAIKLRLFPFSLRDKAKAWYNSLTLRKIETWDVMLHLFLDKFFPPVKVFELQENIKEFVQGENESFQEAWDRYNTLLLKCPNHGFENWQQIHFFYKGLTDQWRNLLDATSGDSFLSKGPSKAKEIIEKKIVIMKNYPRKMNPKGKSKVEVYEVDKEEVLEAKLDILIKEVALLKKGCAESGS